MLLIIIGVTSDPSLRDVKLVLEKLNGKNLKAFICPEGTKRSLP